MKRRLNEPRYSKKGEDVSNYEPKDESQVSKGVRRMPWPYQPKKDAISCDKLRGMANTW